MPDTAAPPNHVPLQHLPPNATMQLLCSMLQVHPKTTGLHCIHLSTPFLCKRNLSKDTFFSGYNYHVAEGDGRPSIICQQQRGGGSKKKKKKARKENQKDKKHISLSNMALETSLASGNMQHQQYQEFKQKKIKTLIICTNIPGRSRIGRFQAFPNQGSKQEHKPPF